MTKLIDFFKSTMDLSTSRRVVIAVLGFLAPIISDKFGYKLTEDQLIQLTGLVMTVIAALTVRDHNPKPVAPVVSVVEVTQKD